MPQGELGLRSQVNEFVAGLFAGYRPRFSKDPKVIHDRIWGTQRFYAHEIALIDSPVVQRLRRIFQTGYSYLTYPSTAHTRFEHSLGAAAVATRMLQSLSNRHPNLVDMHPLSGDLATIRIAALLHDCGHCFASHVSETIYRWLPVFQNARDTNENLRDAKASEILSWFIVTSEPVRELLGQINGQYGTALRPEQVADLILGVPAEKQNAFLAEILNGPFDVDRVDYIVRDSEYAGLQVGVDLERFFHDVDAAQLQDGRRHLVLHSTHAIEQLLWSKVHLFSRVYRHQKVLAADTMVQGLVSIARNSKSTLLGCDFDRADGFLRLTDLDILGVDPGSLDPELAGRLRDLRARNLPLRALTITHQTLKAGGSPVPSMHNLLRYTETPDAIEKVRLAIRDRIASDPKPPASSILLAFPPAPPLREASQVYILLRGRSDPVTLNSLFRIDEWLSTYTDSHWAGYVYSIGAPVDRVAKAALEVLSENGVVIDGEMATAASRAAASGIIPRALPTPLASDQSFAGLPPRLPVLEAFVQGQRNETAPPLAGIHTVLILHFLTDLPPLLDRLELLGLDPAKTWVIRKPYRYQLADNIRKQLEDRHYRIEECTAAEEVEDAARRVLQELQRGLEAVERMLVIEDGGYLTPLLHEASFAALRERCVGIVEQTTKGIRQIEGIDKLLLPVVAVARSRLKATLEAGDVGEALAFTLELFYRRILGKPLSVQTLVVGYGVVGRKLAAALKSRGCRVTVFDSEFDKRAEAQADHFETVEGDTLTDISAFRLVVGTTGKTSLTRNVIETAADGCVLASGSSDRLEFDLAGIRQLVADPIDENVDYDGFLTRYRLKDGRSLGVLCDGFPVNFILGDGIAKSVIDPILTQLVAGAILLATGQISEPGIHDLPREMENDLWRLYTTLSVS